MAKPNLTAEFLHKLFSYDPASGIIVRRVSTGGAKAGEAAGCMRSDGYMQISINRIKYQSHRVAWVLMTGYWPTNFIDHKNSVRNDNRWDNLREATDAQNQQNQRRAQKHNNCGLLGVSRDRKRWRATLRLNNKQIHIGTFDTPQDAHAAYLKAKASLHPFQTLTPTAS